MLLIVTLTLTVMIVSYETLRSLTEYLAGCSIGLLLCDEGHRLKNSGSYSIPKMLIMLSHLCRLPDFPGFE